MASNEIVIPPAPRLGNDVVIAKNLKKAIQDSLRSLQDLSPDALLECVRSVARGQQWIERETLTRAIRTSNIA